MNRVEFYKSFAKRYGISFAKSQRMCNDVFSHLYDRIVNEEDRVYIKGLGTFKKKKTAPRTVGTFNGTGELFHIPAGEKIVFDIYKPTSGDSAEADEESE